MMFFVNTVGASTILTIASQHRYSNAMFNNNESTVVYLCFAFVHQYNLIQHSVVM